MTHFSKHTHAHTPQMGKGKTEAENSARVKRCQRNPDDCADPIDGGLKSQERKGLLSIPGVGDDDFGKSWQDKF